MSNLLAQAPIFKGDMMSSGYIKLNRRFFQRKNLTIDNMSLLSQNEGISYPTILKYLRSNQDVSKFSGDVLFSILINGMGYSLEEASKLELGDLFDFVILEDEEVAE